MLNFIILVYVLDKPQHILGWVPSMFRVIHWESWNVPQQVGGTTF